MAVTESLAVLSAVEAPVEADTPTLNPLPPGLAEVAELVRPTVWAGDRLLPVSSSLHHLLPEPGLRRGSTLVVSGSTSLLLSALAAASADGAWVAVVGVRSLGLVAAAQAGVDLARVALVPNPGAQWAVVTAALIDALDVVVVHPPVHLRSSDVRRLMARARERGTVLMPFVDHTEAWPHADLRLQCQRVQWAGLERGHGHLHSPQLDVTAEGRGSAARPRHARVTMHAYPHDVDTMHAYPHDVPIASGW